VVKLENEIIKVIFIDQNWIFSHFSDQSHSDDFAARRMEFSFYPAFPVHAAYGSERSGCRLRGILPCGLPWQLIKKQTL